MMPVEGIASRPARTRQRSRKVVMIRSQTSVSPNRAKYPRWLSEGGFSRKHAPSTTSSQHVKDPLRTARISTSRSRPPGFAGGISGSRRTHSVSERSEGYLSIDFPAFQGRMTAPPIYFVLYSITIPLSLGSNSSEFPCPCVDSLAATSSITVPITMNDSLW